MKIISEKLPKIINDNYNMQKQKILKMEKLISRAPYYNTQDAQKTKEIEESNEQENTLYMEGKITGNLSLKPLRCLELLERFELATGNHA